MRTLLVFLLLILTVLIAPAYASEIVIFDPNDVTVPNRVIGLLPSAHTPAFEARSDVLINPDKSNVVGTPIREWKVDSDTLIQMNQTEKDALQQIRDDSIEAEIRTSAKNALVGFRGSTLYQRAFADVLKDEINILRSNHGLNARTLNQLKTSIENKIDSGDVD